MIPSKHLKLSYRILTCDIEEGDYYVYDKDEGCYGNGDEGSGYEFDESNFNQQIDLNQQLDYKFDNLDYGYSDGKVVPHKRAASGQGENAMNSASGQPAGRERKGSERKGAARAKYPSRLILFQPDASTLPPSPSPNSASGQPAGRERIAIDFPSVDFFIG